MKTKKVLNCMIDILTHNHIPFVVCGSIRRGLEVYKGLDIATIGTIHNILTCINKELNPTVTKEVVPLKSYCNAFKFSIDSIPITLLCTDAEHFGAGILFLTGNHIFNMVLRSKAKEQGLKLNWLGLWHGDALIAGKTEEQIFNALGYSYVPPENRSLRPGRGKNATILNPLEE